MSFGYANPLAAQSLGYILIDVNPGIVLISFSTISAGFPAFAGDIRKSTRANPAQSQARNAAMLAFLRRQNPEHLASVCTGALILGAAGLLDGRKATTRRTAIGAETHPPLALLAHMGAAASASLIVDAGGPVTGGGVSLAHDLTLHLIGRLYGAAERDEVARLIEYDRAFAANSAALGIVVA